MVVKVWPDGSCPPDYHDKKIIYREPDISDWFYQFWIFQPVMYFFTDEGIVSCDLIAYSEQAVDPDVPEKHLEIEVREIQLIATPTRTRFN